MDYLGHLNIEYGFQPDKYMINSMLNWPLPKILIELRGFLELTWYYVKSVKNYAATDSPLRDLLEKDSFWLTTTMQLSFESLKQAMTITLILALSDFSQSFGLHTDASGVSIGTIL